MYVKVKEQSPYGDKLALYSKCMSNNWNQKLCYCFSVAYPLWFHNNNYDVSGNNVLFTSHWMSKNSYI